jgi:bifunctional non-homologous end joining protein LigD
MPACLQLLEAQTTTSTKTRLLQHVRDNNLEGLVFKRLLAPYTSGRSDDALKFKLVDTATCIVVSHNVQRSVVIGLLVPKGNCTIPPNHPVPPVGALVDVGFLYYTGAAFEQPVYERQRNDLGLDAARADRITRVKPVIASEFALS